MKQLSNKQLQLFGKLVSQASILSTRTRVPIGKDQAKRLEAQGGAVRARHEV